MIVAIPQDITAAGKDYLLEKGYELKVGTGDGSPEAIGGLLRDADALLARTIVYTPDMIRAAHKIKVIARHGVGVDNLPVEYCRQQGIPVFNTPYANATSVAEHTIGLILVSLHDMVRSHIRVCNGEWAFRNALVCADISGKTLGIVGMGQIGTLVAKKAMAAFDMNVIGYDAFLPAEQFPDGIACVDSIQAVFQQADIVSLHAPSTPQTRNCVDRNMLALMKPSATLINCARGDLIVEEDLYDALRSGTIKAAAVDVLREEPPKPNHPLFSLENFIVTPHSAALTEESKDRMGLHAAMGIHAVLSGAYHGETDALYRLV